MEAVAKLRNYPTSPRKMRLLADLIRGKNVEKALAVLEHSTKHPAVPMRKLVLSAIDNWKQKNENGDVGELIVKTIMVDGARVIKRMRPAPQGRGYKIRKRSNHVTVIVDTKLIEEEIEVVEEQPKSKKKVVKAAEPEAKTKLVEEKTTKSKSRAKTNKPVNK